MMGTATAQEKTALLLSAGGMFGAYQAGAWKELSARFRPDLIAGTSVGGLNGWAIAGGSTPDQLIGLWNSESSGAFLKFRFSLNPWRGFFDDASFTRHVKELYSAFTPKLPFGVVLTDLLNRSPRLVRSPEITWQHLAAACTIPTGLPPVRIDGRWYVDGGLLDPLPFWAAFEMGATRVVAVNALPVLPSRVVRATVRVYRRFSRTKARPGSLEVILIEPTASLGTLTESVRWSRDTAQRWIDQGAEDARRVLGSAAPGRGFLSCVLQ
jgi:NTE family protein